MIVIDLSRPKEGCAGHPMIRLNNELRRIKDVDDTVEVIFNANDIPLDAIKIILERKKFKIIDIEEKGSIFRLRCVRVR